MRRRARPRSRLSRAGARPVGQTAPMAARSGRRYLALRTGVAAAAVTSNTFARGLLPRTTTDQAMATGVTAAFGLGVGTLAVSAVEATAELVATSRGRGDPENTTLIAAAIARRRRVRRCPAPAQHEHHPAAHRRRQLRGRGCSVAAPRLPRS